MPLIGILITAIGALSLYFIKQLTASVEKATYDIGQLHIKITELNSNISILLYRNDSCDQKIEKINLQIDNHGKQLEVVRIRLHEIGNIVNELQTKAHIDWAKKE